MKRRSVSVGVLALGLRMGLRPQAAKPGLEMPKAEQQSQALG